MMSTFYTDVRPTAVVKTNEEKTPIRRPNRRANQIFISFSEGACNDKR